MNIAQIQKMPVGEKFGSFRTVVKTTKKKWQQDGGWIHQVVLSDNTGDILADVNIGDNKPLVRAQEVWAIVAEIQATEKGTKLYIDQFQFLDQTEPDFPLDYTAADMQKVVRGKIKCLLVAAYLQSGVGVDEAEAFSEGPQIKRIIDKIIEG